MLYRRATPIWTKAAVVACLVVRPGLARADDAGNRRVAQALFDEARGLMDAGRYGEACPKLAESQRLDPGGGTLLNLATCREREGKTATAWTLLHDLQSASRADGNAEREAIARQKIEALAPRLTRLRVSVSAEARSAAGLAVTVDDLALGSGAWGAAIPVDPGVHRVVARAPGRITWSRDVATPDAASTVEAEVPALPVDASAPQPVGPTKANPVFYGLLAGTAASVTASAVTGTLWLFGYALFQGYPPECDSGRKYCRTQDGIDGLRTGYSLALVSTVTGVLALGGGIAMILVPPRIKGDAKGTARPRVAPTFGPSGAGVHAEVAF